MTFTGVARRRKMPLEGIRVEIANSPLFGGKAEAEEASAEAKSVNHKQAIKRIILKGDINERELQILKNTAKHCPVSRLFGAGMIEFVDEFIVER